MAKEVRPDGLSLDTSAMVPICEDLIAAMKRFVAFNKTVQDSFEWTTPEYVAMRRRLKFLRKELRALQRIERLSEAVGEAIQHLDHELDHRIRKAESINQMSQSGLGLVVVEQPYAWNTRQKHFEIATVGRERWARVRPSDARGKYELILGWAVTDNLSFPRKEDHWGNYWRYVEAVAEARFWVVGGVKPVEKRIKRP